MKVRHKVVRDLHWSVVDEGRDYFIVSTDVATWALPKSQYEPIPTDCWQDVTGECETAEYDSDGPRCRLTHKDGLNLEQVGYPLSRPAPYRVKHEHYRLRKVQFDVPCKPDGGWAFIVERKVE